MLGKHSVIYFIGKALPGIVNFLAISIYTRILLPEDYGTYALVIAGVNMLTTMLYQWLRLVLLRYLPSNKTDGETKILYATIGVGFIIACILSLIFLLVCYFFNLLIEVPIDLLIFGLLLLWVQSFFEIGLDFFRSNFAAKKYAIANLLKSLLAITIGTLLAYFGLGAIGLIIGLLSSTLFVLLIYFREIVYNIFFNLNSFNGVLFRQHLKYGLPLTASFAMNYITNISDRFFIKHYLGLAESGIYSVGYDLSRQTLLIIMMSISLASYPLVIKAYESGGKEAAKPYLSSNLLLLVGISLPSAIGLGLLALPISEIMVGSLYSSDVAKIIPLIAIGAFINGLRSFYLDQSYQLSHKTKLQIYSVAIAAVVNVVLNLILVPRFGIMGAVYSSILCYTLDFLISAMITRSTYKLPVPWVGILKILVCTVIMSVIIVILRDKIQGIYYLIGTIVIGSAAYLIVAGLLKLYNFNSVIKAFSR